MFELSYCLRSEMKAVISILIPLSGRLCCLCISCSFISDLDGSNSNYGFDLGRYYGLTRFFYSSKKIKTDRYCTLLVENSFARPQFNKSAKPRGLEGGGKRCWNASTRKTTSFIRNRRGKATVVISLIPDTF